MLDASEFSKNKSTTVNVRRILTTSNLPMSANEANNSDYKTLSSAAKKRGANAHDQNTLKPVNQPKKNGLSQQSLINPQNNQQNKRVPSGLVTEVVETAPAEFAVSESKKLEINGNNENPTIEKSFSEQQKLKKKEKKADKDRLLLSGDRWLARNGHTLTYVGIYLFSILVLFRPYEIIPSLSFLSATAFYFALATLLIYIPTQFSTEGNLTAFSTEVKAVLVMTLIAIVTIPIAKDPKTAWDAFNEPFVKAVLNFYRNDKCFANAAAAHRFDVAFVRHRAFT